MTAIALKVRPEARTAHPARLDLYAGVHKGLRCLMSDTLVAAGRMDPLDPAELAATAAQIRSLLELCREHLHAENQFLHPAMDARRPGSACATANDHDEHVRAIERLEADLLAVERAGPTTRPGAAQHLYRQFAGFVADNLAHMEIEESDNNAVLWATHTDEELAEIHQAILASLRPDAMAAFVRWIIPAMTPAERAGLLGGVQLGAPRAVFERMLAVARLHLSERDWTKLMAALAPMPVVG